jgi:hypothetical protein
MPLSTEDAQGDVQWKILHLRPSEWPTVEGAAPEGFVFQESPFEEALDVFYKIEQSVLWESMANYKCCLSEFLSNP